MTIQAALHHGTRRLLHADVPPLHPRLDAETLLLHALGRPGERSYLFAHSLDPLDDGLGEIYQELLAQRSAGIPVQYLTRRQEFWGLDLEVTPDVLIPRPETELVVETALALMHAGARVCDVGTGSGCIAIALAHSRPDASVYAVDISRPALSVARRNALRHEAAVLFTEGDLLEPIQLKTLDVIVSNPPYIGTKEHAEVEAQVRENEPALALWAGEDGLDVYRRLLPQAHKCLFESGCLIVEIGHGLTASFLELCEEQTWKSVRSIKDLQGIERVMVCQKAD